MRISEKKNKWRALSWLLLLLLSIIILMLFVYTGIIKSVSSNAVSTERPVTNKETSTIVSPYAGHEFEIDLKNAAYDKISAKRDQAVAQGLLFSSKEDLTDATIRIDGESYPCRLRLKGDLLDHLRGDRWSFRIILKGGKEWKGMNTFSIHNSQSRSHTAEWIMHALFRQENIITPAYDFINVKLNGKKLGVYAYEHHFENQMLDKNNREPGPILKHNDDAYWENVGAELQNFPWVNASEIELFNKSKGSDHKLRTDYARSRKMLQQFLDNKQSAADVFDLERMAKYYALLDLSHAWHAQQFTNIRFYFNPLKGKLEPIAFDCFGDYLAAVDQDWEAFGEGYNEKIEQADFYNKGNVYHYLLFKNQEFYELYLKYLDSYTDPVFLENFKKKINAELSGRVSFITSDTLYKAHRPDWEILFSKAAFTRKKIQPRPHLSLKALRVQDSKSKIELQSFHGFPLEIVGFGNSEEMIDTLGKRLLLESYNPKIPSTKLRYNQSREIDYIYYRTYGLTETHKTRLSKESAAGEKLSLINARKASNIPSFVKQEGNDYYLPAGQHQLSQPLIIPAGVTLHMSPGAEVTFLAGGKLLSYGAIRALGSAQNPIRLLSDGSAGTGILVSGGKQTSQFQHCAFSGLSHFQEKNISTQGAINLNETTAEFSDCTFTGILAKETISCHHSTMDQQRCTFKQCQGSAIVSKYSTLDLHTVKLRDIGMHGIVVKAGSLNGVNINIKKVLQTAVYASDQAYVYFWTLGVEDAQTGILAKGNALVKAATCWLTNLQKGIELRGASEPPTRMEIKKLNHKNNQTLKLMEPGTLLSLDGKQQTN